MMRNYPGWVRSWIQKEDLVQARAQGFIFPYVGKPREGFEQMDVGIHGHPLSRSLERGNRLRLPVGENFRMHGIDADLAGHGL